MDNSIFKTFLDWIKLKFDLHQGDNRPRYFNEGEVWWCHLGKNIGDEENGKHDLYKRPVVVIRKFNTHLALVVPTSTVIKKGNIWYTPFSYHGSTYSGLISHLRTIDVKRLEKKIATLPQEEFNAIKSSIQKQVFRQNGTP